MLLKDLFDFLPKSKRSASYGLTKGKHPFFTSSNIIDKFVDTADYTGEYLIIGDGGTGNCKFYNGSFSVSDHNYVLKPKDSTNTLCIQYFLKKDNYKILNAGFKGVGIKNVSKSYIENINYTYNQTFSENEIVSNLSKIELLIERDKQLLNLLDDLIKSRFIEMFDTIDLSEERNDWIELGELTKIYTGTTPSSTDNSNWNGDILWITPAEMKTDSFYIYDTVRKITEKGRKSKSLDIMPINTVLLSTRAPIGKVGIVGKPMACNQGFKNFKCCERLNPVYLYTILKANTSYLNSLGSGTTFLEVSKSRIAKLKVPLPEINKQKDFENFVKQVDKSKFIVQQQIKELTDLLNKKMDEYFG